MSFCLEQKIRYSRKIAVVRDEQHRAVVVFQVILEPLDRLDVQVIGRLVHVHDRGRDLEHVHDPVFAHF